MYNNGIQIGDRVFVTSVKQAGYISTIRIDQEGEFRYDVQIDDKIYEKLYIEELEVYSLI